MHALLHAAIATAALALAAPVCAQITFYEHEAFRGRVHTTQGALDNFAGWGFNDRASSVVVEKGRWEVCDGIGFTGRCAVLRRGSYDRLSTMGLNDRLASVRPVGNDRRRDNDVRPPMREPDYRWRQRPGERLFEVPVLSVRAVLGPPERRCWVERGADRMASPADIAVLGHRVGGGVVRRCETQVDETPAFWEVGYRFRGAMHNIRMSQPPERIVTVNRNGEPRM